MPAPGPFARVLPAELICLPNLKRRVFGDIERIKRRYGFDFPIDVLLREYDAGILALYICDDGFIVAKKNRDTYTDRLELYLWFAASWSGVNVLDRYYDDIQALARGLGCQSIVFDTKREGFKRMAKRKAWNVQHSYRIALD